jgi:protein-tyrosine phosphatase/arsenate reductase
MLNFLLPFLVWFATPSNTVSNMEMTLETSLNEMVARAESLPQSVAEARLDELDALAAWLAEQPSDAPVELMFICTHNSRRSHMGQIWAQAAAWHFGLDHVRTFSGGTEATTFNPRAVRAMQELGVAVEMVSEGSNPRYRVRLQGDRPAFEVFSKKYGDEANPQKGYAAVMVCGSADAGCPIVYGSAARFSIPYVDPKVSDGTDAEQATYRERSLEIGTEAFYVMARAAELRAH